MKKSMYRSFDAGRIDGMKQKDPSTVAERLLVPTARGIETTPAFILDVLRGSKNDATFRDLCCEIFKMLCRHGDMASKGAGRDVLSRYETEVKIITTARDMLAGMLWGGQA